MPYLDRLTWRDAEAYFKQNDTVLFGVGALHGHDHIPAGIDNLSVEYFVREMEKRTGLMVVPTLNFGPMANYMDFPGCISPRVETFRQLVSEIVHDLYKWGARKIIIVNGHGGNTAALLDVGYEIRKKGAVMPLLEWWRLYAAVNPQVNAAVNALPASATPGRKSRTRGIETAVAMVLVPEGMPDDTLKVVYAREKFGGALQSHFATAITYRGFNVPTAFGSRETTDIGEVGTRATPELGKQILAECLDYMVGFAQELSKQPAPPYTAE